jgi:transcriptional regulator with XRE-family HTH domain
VAGYQEIGLAVLRQLDAIRVAKKISQGDLGDRIGVNQSVVSQTLRGRYPDWRISTIVKFAAGLGYEVEVTLRRKPPQQ